MTTSFTGGKFRETDANGDPLAGGLLYTYASGTLTPLVTYTDFGGLSPNTNPIVLDSAGRANIWLGSSAYRMILKAADGSTVWDQDPILSIGSPNGSSAVGFLQAGTGAIARTAQDKLREIVSVLDFGAVGDGVADDTAKIQNALNVGRKVIFNAGKTYLTTGNDIPSNTHLVFERGASLKAANGMNRAVLQNVNFQKAGWGGATYGIDSNITIEGLYVDGNQAAQAKFGSGVYASEPTTGLRFFGVTNLLLRDITVFQARNYAIWCCAIFNGTYNNIRFDQFMGGTPDNQDGLHIQGPASNLDIRNIRGATNDDMIALNADDVPQGANVTTGAITNALIDGVYPLGALNGVRLLSATSRMDQITVRTVKGSTRDVAVQLSPFGLGPGNVGAITIQDIDVRCSNHFQPTSSYYYSVITVDGVVDSISAQTVKVVNPADNRPVITVADTANIGVLDISGLYVTESAASTISGIQAIASFGLINTLIVRDLTYLRDTTLTPTGSVVSLNAPAKGVTNLICTDWVVGRFVTPIRHVDGKLTFARLTNIMDTNGLANFPLCSLESISPQLTTLVMSNCRTEFGRKLAAIANSGGYAAGTMIEGASGAMASLPGNQACPLGVYTKLNFSASVVDRVVGEYSAGAQTFTVSQAPGLYIINCMVDLATPTNPTDVTLALHRNGVIYRVFPGSQRYTIPNAEVGGSIHVVAAQGDVFDVRLFCTANTTANSTANTVVSYERME